MAPPRATAYAQQIRLVLKHDASFCKHAEVAGTTGHTPSRHVTLCSGQPLHDGPLLTLSAGRGAAQRAYWRQQLADAPLLLEMPTDFPRPPKFTGRGASVHVEVPAAQVAALRALAASCGATTFMALLAVWQVSVQPSALPYSAKHVSACRRAHRARAQVC